MGDPTLFPGNCAWDRCVCRTGLQSPLGRRAVCADLRFLSKITKSESCWRWTGTVNTYGYGQIVGPPADKRLVQAHVYAWIRCGYLLPEGAVLRHSCDNRLCVRPDHLELGTPQDNVDDTWKRGRARPRGQTLNAAQVREIRRARTADGSSYQELADQFGVTYTTIARVCTGRTWKEVALWTRGDLPAAWKCCATRSGRCIQGPRCGPSGMLLTGLLRPI